MTDEEKHTAIMSALHETHAVSSGVADDVTLARAQLTALDKTMGEHLIEDRMKQEEFDRRITLGENRNSGEASGQYDIADLKAQLAAKENEQLKDQLAKRDASAKDVKGRVVSAVVGLLAAGLIALVTVFVNSLR